MCQWSGNTDELRDLCCRRFLMDNVDIWHFCITEHIQANLHCYCHDHFFVYRWHFSCVFSCVFGKCKCTILDKNSLAAGVGIYSWAGSYPQQMEFSLSLTLLRHFVNIGSKVELIQNKITWYDFDHQNTCYWDCVAPKRMLLLTWNMDKLNHVQYAFSGSNRLLLFSEKLTLMLKNKRSTWIWPFIHTKTIHPLSKFLGNP